MTATNKVYNDLFGDKTLDMVLEDYANSDITFNELKFYLEYNEFDINDIDIKSINKVRNKRKKQ